MPHGFRIATLPLFLSRASRKRYLAEELEQPRRWWFVSFCDDNGQLGSCIVRAQGELTAVQRTVDLGICPMTEYALERYKHNTRQVSAYALGWRDMKKIPDDMRNRLIPVKELCKRLDGRGVWGG